jgi:hypothetical protein
MTSERHPFQGRETRMRRETSYGVAGSTDFVRLNGLSMTISPAVTTNEVTVPGVMVQTGVTVDDLFSTAKLDGVIDPNALTFIFAGLFGTPAFTSLGSGAYQWDWAWKGRKPNRPVSFEVYSGYAQRAERALGYISNTLSISGARPDGFKVSGDGFAKTSTRGQVMGGVAFERQTITKSGTVTGGTFTLTFNGETTATIAYDAIASAIQTALEGVFGIEPGDVVVGGGPISTTPATIDFIAPVSPVAGPTASPRPRPGRTMSSISRRSSWARLPVTSGSIPPGPDLAPRSNSTAWAWAWTLPSAWAVSPRSTPVSVQTA